MDVRRLPQPTSYQMLMDEIAYVKNNPQLCKTFVLDTADWAEKLCRENVCSRYQKGGMEDFGYGKGYTYVYEDFGKLLNALDELTGRGVHVIVTAHAIMRKFEQPDEMGAYDRWELKLNNSPRCSIANMLKEWADMVLFANYETIVVKNEAKKNKAQGGRRVMYTAHHPCWDAKNRFGLPEKLPFDFGQVASLFDLGQTQTTQRQQPEAPVQGPETQETSPTVDDDDDLPFEWTQDSGIPKALQDLMQMCGVTEDEIVDAVAQKGYFPANMRVADYPTDFVQGVLIGAWDQVYNMIKTTKGV
jgi:single-stranded DNA-binding protein